MNDLIVEVDEAMKQERLEKLWQSYGGFFLGLIAMLILGTAAKAGYDHFKNQKNIIQTDIYLDALIDEHGNSDSLIAAHNKIQSPELKALVKIHAAGKAVQEGKKEDAVKLYNIEPTSSESINGLSLMMQITQSDMAASEKTSALEPLYLNQKNPWRYHAYLEAAIINAHEKNDYKKARDLLKEIVSAENIPQTLQKKARSLDILYALKGNQK